MATIKTKQVVQKWDFELYQNDPWPPVSFELFDENQNPVTGFTTLMQIRVAQEQKGTPEKELSETYGFTANGNKRTFAAISNLRAHTFYYDTQVTLASGVQHTIFYGTIKVRREISRTDIASLPVGDGTGWPTYTVVIPGANAGVTVTEFNDDFNEDFNT